jgi:hypothetical protein
MSTARVAVLGLIILGSVMGVVVNSVQEQKAQRVQDYANLMTDTHGRAMKMFSEASAKLSGLRQRIDQGGTPDSDLLNDAKTVYLDVAEKTREERDRFALVVPPPEAESLQEEAIEFLDHRAKLAETTASYYELVERGMREGDVTEADIARVVRQADKEQAQMMAMAKELSRKKDQLTLR